MAPVHDDDQHTLLPVLRYEDGYRVHMPAAAIDQITRCVHISTTEPKDTSHMVDVTAELAPHMNARPEHSVLAGAEGIVIDVLPRSEEQFESFRAAFHDLLVAHPEAHAFLIRDFAWAAAWYPEVVAALMVGCLVLNRTVMVHIVDPQYTKPCHFSKGYAIRSGVYENQPPGSSPFLITAEIAHMKAVSKGRWPHNKDSVIFREPPADADGEEEDLER